MKVDSTTIGMESARTYKSMSREATFSCISLGAVTPGNFKEMIGLSPDGTGRLETGTVLKSDGDSEVKKNVIQEKTAGAEECEQENLQDIFERLKARENQRAGQLIGQNMQNRIKQQTLQYLLRLIWGYDKERARAAASSDMLGGVDGAVSAYPADAGGYYGSAYSADGLMTGTQMRMTSGKVQIYYESEQTSFSTKGNVQTADGRSIDFNIEVSMSREFMEYTGVKISESIILKDPLVINLDGNPATVSDQKFYFDIDADGKEDLIPQLSSGSGMLALDRNDDGIINDGTELFGTQSGDAFSDLAEFDLDLNGWIDEADEVFAKLSIWTADATGEMKQISLKEAGIGAICLKNADTAFSVKDLTSNATEAVIRKTGMFLFESGHAGTIQEMDFAIA